VFGATGGRVRGPGTGTSDSINARLSNGEYVINAKSTKKFGGLIAAINRDKLPGFKKGGKAKITKGDRIQKGLDGFAAFRSNRERAANSMQLQLSRARLTGTTRDDVSVLTRLMRHAMQTASLTQRWRPGKGALASAQLRDEKNTFATSAYDNVKSYRDQIADILASGKPAAVEASSGDNSDLQAQLAQAQAQATTARGNLALSERAFGVFSGSGDIGGGGSNALAAARGGTTINIQTLHPGDPRVLAAIAEASTQGSSAGRTANRLYTGRVRLAT
jgi:hypothetical protein